MPRNPVALQHQALNPVERGFSDTKDRQAGSFDEAAQRIGQARERLWDLVAKLNDHADAVFGATPTAMLGKSEETGPGALARMFREIGDLEDALPAFERAVERFAPLA